MDLMTTENYGSSSDEKEENHQQGGQSGNKSNQRSLHDNKQIRTYQEQSASLEVTNREGNGGSMNGRNHHLLWGSLPLPQKSHGLEYRYDRGVKGSSYSGKTLPTGFYPYHDQKTVTNQSSSCTSIPNGGHGFIKYEQTRAARGGGGGGKMMYRGRIIHKYDAAGENQTDERFSSIQSHHNTQLRRLKNDDNRFDQENRKHMPLIAITHNNTGWRNRSSQSTTRYVDDDLGTKQQSKRGSAEIMQIAACSNTSDMEPEATEDNKENTNNSFLESAQDPSINASTKQEKATSSYRRKKIKKIKSSVANRKDNSHCMKNVLSIILVDDYLSDTEKSFTILGRCKDSKEPRPMEFSDIIRLLDESFPDSEVIKRIDWIKLLIETFGYDAVRITSADGGESLRFLIRKEEKSSIVLLLNKWHKKTPEDISFHAVCLLRENDGSTTLVDTDNTDSKYNEVTIDSKCLAEFRANNGIGNPRKWTKSLMQECIGGNFEFKITDSYFIKKIPHEDVKTFESEIDTNNKYIQTADDGKAHSWYGPPTSTDHENSPFNNALDHIQNQRNRNTNFGNCFTNHAAAAAATNTVAPLCTSIKPIGGGGRGRHQTMPAWMTRQRQRQQQKEDGPTGILEGGSGGITHCIGSNHEPQTFTTKLDSPEMETGKGRDCSTTLPAWILHAKLQF